MVHVPEDQPELSWIDLQIPLLHTPINQVELLRNKRLIILLWYLDEFTQGYQVAGQLNVPMYSINELGGDIPPFMSAFELDMTNTNEVCAKVDFKFHYNIQNSAQSLKAS